MNPQGDAIWAGEVQWARTGSNSYWATVQSIDTDEDGNLYATVLNLSIADKSQLDQVEIMGLTGNSILQYRNEVQLDIEELLPGLYLVRILFKDGSVSTSKFLKQ